VAIFFARFGSEAATQLLGFERRQVFRLLKAHRTEDATGLFSKQHGKPEEVLAIIRGQYWDLGPTLAAEKLREGHGIALGREALRKCMIADECGSIASSRSGAAPDITRRRCGANTG
jgi:hypothetical protein